MDKQLDNPFLHATRGSWVTSGPSLLDYGDGTISLYNRLHPSKNRSTLSENQTVQLLLSKYENQLYSLDQQGHCLAESLLQDAITEPELSIQDFWGERLPQVHTSKKLTQSFAEDSRGGQARKIRHKVAQCKKLVKKVQKDEEDKSIQAGLTLSELYQAKRQKLAFKPLFTINPQPTERSSEPKESYHPSSIRLRQQLYYSVPLQ